VRSASHTAGMWKSHNHLHPCSSCAIKLWIMERFLSL